MTALARITPPVQPYQGLRTIDAWGAGSFGAPRDRGERKHLGLDFLATIGSEVVAPIAGTITLVGRAYPDSTLGTLTITGAGVWDGWTARLLYVATPYRVGAALMAGERCGVVEDVSGYWKRQKPDHKGVMPNHLHLSITAPTDPALLLPEGLVVVPPGPTT